LAMLHHRWLGEQMVPQRQAGPVVSVACPRRAARSISLTLLYSLPRPNTVCVGMCARGWVGLLTDATLLMHRAPSGLPEGHTHFKHVVERSIW
jgi:hypothetical protein